MPFYFKNKLGNILLLAFLGCVFLADRRVGSLHCYVCNNERDSQIPCANFSASNEIYRKDCYDKNGSCSLIKNAGKTFERSCEKLVINDCKQTSDAVYCYCTSDLCNGEIEIPDDEDMSEGSGVEVEVNFVTAPSQPKASSVNTNIANFLLVCAILMLPALPLHGIT